MHYYKHPFLKLYAEDISSGHHSLSVDSTTGDVLISGINLTKDVNVVFFRRITIKWDYRLKDPLGSIEGKIRDEANRELFAIFKYIFYCLKDKMWLPKPSAFNLNKEIVLSCARDVGLLTPHRLITNRKDDLKRFMRRCKKVISKPIEGSGYYTLGYYTYSSYTSTITKRVFDALPERFFPSLFQEFIPSEYEIRVFYLDGEFYPTAMLSNKKNQSADIKELFASPFIHHLTYKLPKDVENSLIHLMKDLDLNTGSIDILKSTGGSYYFLEVNPVGQYLAPSFSCNYNIEKIIAEWLIKNDQSILL